MPRTGKRSTEELAGEVQITAQKAVASAKKATKKAETKIKQATKKPVKEEIYLQYMGKEISKTDLMKQVKEIWTKKMKRKVSEMSTVTLYLKPEENKVYFVINGEESGSISI